MTVALLILALALLGCALLPRLTERWGQGQPTVTPTETPAAAVPTPPALPRLTPDALDGLRSFRLRLVWSWTVHSPGTEGMRVTQQQSLWLHEYRQDLPARRMVFVPLRSPLPEGNRVPGAELPMPELRQWVQIGDTAWQCPGVLLTCEPVTPASPSPTAPLVTPDASQSPQPPAPLYPAPGETTFDTQPLTSTLVLTDVLPASTPELTRWIDPQPGAAWVGQPLLAGIEGLVSQLQPSDFRFLGVETVRGVRCLHLLTTSPLLVRPLHPGSAQEAQDIQAHLWLADQPDLPAVVMRLLLTWRTQIGATRGEGVFSYELLDLNAPLQIQPPVSSTE